ncbi:hypothetical protein F4823DRAFT_568175 [Ustulina deusta]|nr:hypothetical protein F4823DRAFT_568175 [Ustulina deusta]
MDKGEKETVAFRTRTAEYRFRKLISQLETGSGKSSVLIKAATDSLERFKLWAGNIGARQSADSPASLEARLTTAKRILEQVDNLLDDLILALDDLLEVASGSRENRRIIHKHTINNTDPSPVEYQLEAENNPSPQKNDVLIQKATPRDRFARSLQSDNPFIDQFDINHVVDTFPKLSKPGSEWLCVRLGRAITKRRQFLCYSREHRSRPAGPDIKYSEGKNRGMAFDIRSNEQLDSLVGKKLGGSITPYTHGSTKASTPDITALQRPREDEANREDTGSFISAGSSLQVEGSKSRLHLPSLEKLGFKGSSNFECPFCLGIQTITRESAWKRHAYKDLKAYVCTLGEGDGKCDSEIFGDSRSWFDHELQCHRKQWMCVICSKGPFGTPADFKSHMKDMHANVSINDSQLEIFMSAGQRAVVTITADECPFCDEWVATLKNNATISESTNLSQVAITVEPVQFRRHVASHMEQLALFAISRDMGDNELEEDSGKAAASSRSTVKAELQSPIPGISNADDAWIPDPPLHIAAASGDLATFRVLLEEGADIHSRGETWGTVSDAAFSCQQSTRDRILSLLRSHYDDGLLPDILPSTKTRDGQPSITDPASGMNSPAAESITIDDNIEITPETLVLRDNGSVITHPPMFAGVPLEKISENHPFWNPKWEPLERTVQAALDEWQERLENLQRKPNAMHHTIFLINCQVNQGKDILDFLKNECFHPLQFASREMMDQYYNTFVTYDTLFLLVKVHEELKKFDLKVTPLEWLRQRFYEIATAQGKTFDLSMALHVLNHDKKLKALREIHGFGNIGRHWN